MNGSFGDSLTVGDTETCYPETPSRKGWLPRFRGLGGGVCRVSTQLQLQRAALPQVKPLPGQPSSGS